MAGTDHSSGSDRDKKGGVKDSVTKGEEGHWPPDRTATSRQAHPTLRACRWHFAPDRSTR